MSGRMKSLVIKAVAISVGGIAGGLAAGVFFSIWFYAFLPRSVCVKVYCSDTWETVGLRFWIAFAVGAVAAMIWIYRAIKDTCLD